MKKYEEIDVMNPAPRIPVVLVLDTSGSMKGEPIKELNSALQKFIKDVSNDEAASTSVELEIIPMTESAEPLVEFSPVWQIHEKQIDLTAGHGTYIGKALQRTLEDLNTRVELYQSNGITYYMPWVFMMTDGKPGDKWEEPANILCELADKRRLFYYGVGIGNKCDFNILKKMLPATPGPLKLQGLHFRELFKWLTASLQSVSRSAVSDEESSSMKILTWDELI